MKKVFKFVKGKKDEKEKREGVEAGRSQSRETSSPGRTPEDEGLLAFDPAPGYMIDFCERDKSLTKLHKAAWLGHLDKLKSALKKVEVDAVDRHNRSALHLAVARGHPNIVWYLLGNDAKVSICDGDGCTPLLKAVECGHKDCMTLLLERGADVNHADYNGNTGLHIAAGRATLDILSTLLSRGALVDVPNNCGEYPLHIATRIQSKDSARLLLRSGASVNVFDRENRTPLMLSAKTGNVLLARLFVEHGAILTTVDSNGWTAEDYAMLCGHESVAEELRARAAAGEPSAGRQDEEAGAPGSDGPRSARSDSPQEDGTAARGRGPGSEEDEDTSGSAAAEAIPPPCRPPRSWEMIRAGMIDPEPEAGGSGRLDPALAASRTDGPEHRFPASDRDPARYTLSLNRRKPVKRNDSIARHRFSFNEEPSFVSDASDTLREIDKMDLNEIRAVDPDGGNNPRRIATSDWDSDGFSAPTDDEDARKPRPTAPSKQGSIRSSYEALNGVDEVWVSDARIAPEPTTTTDGGPAESTCWDSESTTGRDGEASAAFPFPAAKVHSAAEISSCPCPATSGGGPRGYCDGDGDRSPNARDHRDSIRTRHHARHRSVSAHDWRSQELPQRSFPDVERRISEQLRCYDEALEELAEASRPQGRPRGTDSVPDSPRGYRSLPASARKKEPRARATRPGAAPEGRDPCETASLPTRAGDPGAAASAPPQERPSGSSDGGGSDSEEGAASETARKRQALLAMRELGHAVRAPGSFGTSVDDQVLSPLTRPTDSDRSDSDESNGRDGQLFFRTRFPVCGRQETVIEKSNATRKSSGSGTGEESTLWTQKEPEASPACPPPEESSSEGTWPIADSRAGGDCDGGDARVEHSPDVSFSSGPVEAIGEMKDSGSEGESSHNETSPAHNYTLEAHHEWLKNHLEATTSEKNKLEQVAMELTEKAERLQYELNDAKEATKSKEEVITLLQSQLTRMESAYTKSLEESVLSRLQLANHEQEILHLKELCYRYEEEKELASGAVAEDESAALRARIKSLEEERESMMKDIFRLEQEKGALEKRLQEATTSEIIDQCQRWQERCERLESARANDENHNAYLAYLRNLGQEYADRERQLSERVAELEKMLLEEKERSVELDVRVQGLLAADSDTVDKGPKREPIDSLTELSKRNQELEAHVRRLERDVEESNIRNIREKETEMQALLQRFADERDALVKGYESRLADKRSEETERDSESWRRENEALRETVLRLQEQFANLLLKSSSEQAKEETPGCGNRTTGREEDKVNALMKENARLKKEINQVRTRLAREGGERPHRRRSSGSAAEVSGFSVGQSELHRLREEVQVLREALYEDRNSLDGYREKNARLEKHLKKLSEETKRRTPQETSSTETMVNRQRGVGAEDVHAWNTLYGIRVNEDGRGGVRSPEGKTERSLDAGGGADGSVNIEYERTKQEIRHLVDTRMQRKEREENEGRERCSRVQEDRELSEMKRQMLLMQDRMTDEGARRRALEGKLAEAEDREKQRLETEVTSLRRKIAEDLVPRIEVELMRRQLQLQRNGGKREESDGDVRREDFRVRCERYAEEMDRSKQIRRRTEPEPEPEPSGERDLGTTARRQGSSARVLIPALQPFGVPIPSVPSALEPEIKSRLNEELDRSIQKHLSGESRPRLSYAC